MTDYLAQFTPDELELIRAQNGKFTFNDNVLHFDIDLPDALIEKMSYLSFRFYADNVNDPETRKETIVNPEKNARLFLELFGLTDEKSDEQPKGIVVKFGDNPAQFVPTLKGWTGALSPKTSKNQKAYIAKSDSQLRFIFENNGDIRIDVADDVTAFEEIEKSKPIPAKETDTDLLYTLASAVNASYIKSKGYIITVYLPDFARAMSVQFAEDGKNNHYDFKQKLTDLENLIGVLVEEKKIEVAFKILSLDQNERTLTFASPYFYSLMDRFEKERIKSPIKKNNVPLWNIKGVSYLVSTRINSARSKLTAQIVYYIVSQIHNHGNDPDSKKKPQKTRNDTTLRTIKVKYSDIVKNTPLLKETLKEANSSRRNQILNRAIFGDRYNKRSSKPQTTLLEEYLRAYTKIFEYWVGLEISFDSVSMKTLDHCVTITHHGINGDFKDFYQIPTVEESNNIFDDE